MIRKRECDERGAALVEFAFVVPILFLLVFGIIDFGSAFNQHLDVRHGAREAARLAAVNYPGTLSACAAGGTASCNNTQRTSLVTEACNRMSLKSGVVVKLTRTDGPDTGANNWDIGDSVTVTVEKPLKTLTKFLDFALKNITLRSTVKERLEQPAQWSESSTGVNCP